MPKSALSALRGAVKEFQNDSGPVCKVATGQYIGSDLWRKIDALYVLARQLGRYSLVEMVQGYDTALMCGKGQAWLETYGPSALALCTGAEVSGSVLVKEIREVFTSASKVNFDGVFE